MKKSLLVYVLVIVVIASCNLPVKKSPPAIENTPLPTQLIAASKSQATDIPVVNEPDLDHHPLYWFGPLPPLPVGGGRPNIWEAQRGQ